jgi:glutamyl-tRNA synthetase
VHFVTDATNRPVRTRFAPSPTGSLHIGGLRTAMFNWLFARHNNGRFVLRIEDTDQKRYDPNALTSLMEALRWAGLDWDEGPDIGGAYGPYVQSERLALYQKWANWLVEQGEAYPSYETPQELEQIRKDLEAKKLPPGYNRQHRDLTAEQRAVFEAEGRKPVIRLKMPLEGETVTQDAIRGEVRFENAKQQDIVLLKSDGFPTYHLAHVVDDHFMEISHVLRAVEWLPSVPVHWQLWLAFGWEPPVYAHLPVMLNPNGKGKMSKRNPPRDAKGNIIPVLVHDYIHEGYLPEAITNFLANIGWNFGDEREIFKMDEAVERFDLSRINEANSAFPPEKLEWLNGLYIREMPAERLTTLLRKPLENAGLRVDNNLLARITPLVQGRMKTLNDVVNLAGFFFQDEFKPAPSDMLIQKNMDAETTRTTLQHAYERLATLDTFTHEAQEAAMRDLAESSGMKPSTLFSILRVATTGQSVSTPLFETMEILGKDEALRRIQDAANSLAEIA